MFRWRCDHFLCTQTVCSFVMFCYVPFYFILLYRFLFSLFVFSVVVSISCINLLNILYSKGFSRLYYNNNNNNNNKQVALHVWNKTFTECVTEKLGYVCVVPHSYAPVAAFEVVACKRSIQFLISCSSVSLISVFENTFQLFQKFLKV